MKNNFIKVSKISLVLVYLVILAGSLVRMTGSGMGCPDWPKCFGLIIPPTDISQIEWSPNKIFKKGIVLKKNNELIIAKKKFLSKEKFNNFNWVKYTKHNYSDFNPSKTWIEFLNRLIGAIAGLATLIMLVFSIRFWKKNKIVVFSSLLIVAGMGFQAWLGKTVVDSNLAPFKITIHMLMAFIIIALLIYCIYITDEKSKNILNNIVVKYLILVSLLLSLIQVVIGTQVREFIDLQYELLGPENKNKWLSLPDLYFYFHRSFSILILAINAFLYYITFKRKYNTDLINKICIVILLEIIVGVVMFYGSFPLFSQPIHLFLATILFGYQFYWFLHFTKIRQ
jgi:cytochrome c oxidase assembly protein subunit 15